jgi:dTDP-4-amino-4,6-dideoxygalactose transaminase
VNHVRWPILGEPERRAVERVMASGVLSGPNAPESIAFEREFARFVEARHALLTHSGTSALQIALLAADIGAGDHVLCPAYSFVATPLAILHAGAIPIFVDVDEETGAIDPEAARAAVTPRTRAIMPVHVHGCAVDMKSLLELAERERLVIVEDAAQAHGATWNGCRVGAIGRAGGFSLQSSKNLGVGEGGVFVTNDDAVAEHANCIRNFGQPVGLPGAGGFDVEKPLDSGGAPATVRLGAMYRGNELAACLGRAMLGQLEERTERCREHADQLSRALAELPGVLPPKVPAACTSVHHKYRVRLDPRRADVDASPRAFRDAVAKALGAEGLEVVTWQNVPLPAHPIFQSASRHRTFPWSVDHETPFDALYDPAMFPRTSHLLDCSLVLFSQSFPLIAQTTETVERYAAAFARVWARRHELV